MQEGADVHVSIGQTAQAQFDRAADAIRLIQPTTQAALRQSVREDTGTGALTAY